MIKNHPPHMTCLHTIAYTGEYPINDSKRLCVHLIDQAIAMLDNGAEASSSSSPSSSSPDGSPPMGTSVGRGGGGGGGGGGTAAVSRVEQIVGIFDLKDFSVTRNADFAFAFFMVEAFFEYYPR